MRRRALRDIEIIEKNTDPDPSFCACGGSGWIFLNEQWYKCPYHWKGQAAPKEMMVGNKRRREAAGRRASNSVSQEDIDDFAYEIMDLIIDAAKENDYWNKRSPSPEAIFLDEWIIDAFKNTDFVSEIAEMGFSYKEAEEIAPQVKKKVENLVREYIYTNIVT